MCVTLSSAYHPNSSVMKHLLTGCVALLLSTVAISQPPTDPYTIICDSTPNWSGLGIPDQFDYLTLAGSVCDNLTTAEGKYGYWGEEPPFGTEVMIPSGHDLTQDIYGLKGHGGIGNHPNNPPLTAVVFETQMQLLPGMLQNPEEPSFSFRDGSFEFQFLYVDVGSTIIIEPGVTVSVKSGIVLRPNSVIEVQEGGTLILVADPETDAGTCVIDNQGGTITGTIQRQLAYQKPAFDYSAWDGQEITEQTHSAAFTFATGLVNVNMHQVAQMIQDTIGIQYLDGSYDRPTVQLSTWGHREDLVEDFGYLAHNAYMSDEAYNDYASEYLDILGTHYDNTVPSYYYWGAPVALDGGRYISIYYENAPTEQKREPTIGHYGFDKHSGIGNMPLYTNNEGTLEDLFSNPQLLKLATGATGGTDTYQSLIATTDSQHGWMARVTDISADIMADEGDYYIFTFEGTYVGVPTQTLTNSFRLIEDTKDHEELGIFQDTLYHTYVETGSVFPIDIYVGENELVEFEELSIMNINENANENSYGYHHIDMTGFNLIRNNSHNIVRFQDLAAQINQQAPYTQLAFYDIAALSSDLNHREVLEYDLVEYNDEGDQLIDFHEERDLHLPIISNFIKLPYSSTGTALVDILNYFSPEDEVNTYGSLGGYLMPGQVVGFNFQDPHNTGRYNLEEITIDLSQIDRPVAYTNMGAEVLSPLPTAFQGYQYNALEVVEDLNADYAEIIQPTRTANTHGIVEMASEVYYPELETITQSELDGLNEVTLLELHAEDSNGDQFRLATIPLSINANFNSDEPDLFKSTAGVNPGFYLINDDANQHGNTIVGSYSHGTDQNVDSLRLVVNPYQFPGDWVEMWVTAPVAQEPKTSWNHPWHWRMSDSEYGTANMRLDNPDFDTYTVWTSAGGYTNAHSDESDYLLGFDDDTYFNEAGMYEQEFAVLTLYPCWMAADLNYDGCVTTSDLIVFLGYYGLSNGQSGFNSNYDFNGDGIIGVADLSSLLGYWNQCWNDGLGNEVTPIESPLIASERIRRLETIVKLKDLPRNHSPYNIWTDYAWPNVQMKTFLQNKLTISDYHVFVTDEFGWIHHTQPLGDGTINLPSSVPTNAELQAMTPDLPIATGLRIYMKCKEPVQPPGYTAATDIFCLGCSTTEVSHNPTTTAPVFD